MKIRSTILLFLLTLLSAGSVASAPPSGKSLQSALQHLSDSNNLAGTQFVAVVNEHGLASFDVYSKEKQTFDENSPFLIASHTKAMTSTLAAILQADGKIDLSKSVAHYDKSLLTNPKLNADAITLSQLLTHTSGFTSIQHTFKTAFLGYKNQTEAVASLNFNTLVAPNHAFRYSNTGPVVAAMVMESRLGKPWQTLLQNHVFSPLGMTSTTAQIHDGISPSMITARDGSAFQYGHFKTNETLHASGGIVSTAKDLARWLQVNINADEAALGTKNVFETLHNVQVDQDKMYFTYHRTGYTLGWDVASYQGETLLTRFGTYAGYSVHVSFMPQKKMGVIAFTNQDVAFALPHVIANYAYNMALGNPNAQEALKEESARLKKSVDKGLASAPDNRQIVPASQAPQYALGTFENQQNWPAMTIFIDNNQVRVKWGTLEGVLLQRGEEYEAHLGSLVRPLTIEVNADGEVELRSGSLVYNKI